MTKTIGRLINWSLGLVLSLPLLASPGAQARPVKFVPVIFAVVVLPRDPVDGTIDKIAGVPGATAWTLRMR